MVSPLKNQTDIGSRWSNVENLPKECCDGPGLLACPEHWSGHSSKWINHDYKRRHVIENRRNWSAIVKFEFWKLFKPDLASIGLMKIVNLKTNCQVKLKQMKQKNEKDFQ